MLPRARTPPAPSTARPRAEEPAAQDLACWGLQHGRRTRVQTPDDAMAGTLRPGEWLVADPVVPTLLVPGDVVLAALRDGLTARRVESLELRRSGPGQLVAAWLTLTGDRGGEPLLVEGSQILGRALGVDRDGVILPIPPRPFHWPLPLALRTLFGLFALALALFALSHL